MKTAIILLIIGVAIMAIWNRKAANRKAKKEAPAADQEANQDETPPAANDEVLPAGWRRNSAGRLLNENGRFAKLPTAFLVEEK